MGFSRIGYWLFRTAIKTARATGLTRPLRKILGPAAGRMVTGASDPERQHQVNGHSMYLAGPGRYPPVDMAMDRFEPATTELIQSIVSSGMVVLDIGAHAGYYTLLAARGTGTEGRVYAFEPEPENFKLLTKNIEANGYLNITPVNLAVSDQVGTRTLFVTSLDNGRHSMFHHSLPESGQIDVGSITIDKFLEGEGWPTIGLVKVDVEGAESEVLDGMRELFSRSTDVKLIIEFNPCLLKGAGVDLLGFLDEPAKLGFNVQYIDEQKGAIDLTPSQLGPMVERLVKRENSLNLFCSKK
jgi:FkbM family methyltransferase